MPGGRFRVVSVITRLNIGGPAQHAALLAHDLRALGFDPVLVHGSIPHDEGSLEDLVAEHGVRAVRIPQLGRVVHPLSDLWALWQLTRLLFRERPDILHTHTAKAGTLGRLAAGLFNVTRARGRRCAVIHTFHGHVFSGYFGGGVNSAIRLAERGLACITDRVITLSETQRHDICHRFRVAPPSRTEIVKPGVDIDRLLDVEADVGLRAELDLEPNEVVFGYVGRFAPIKNLPMLVRAFSRVATVVAAARLLLVGDGDVRPELVALVNALGIGPRVRFTGWRRDLPAVYGAMDVCVLCSRNEGSPVALIEAMAARRPVIATAVGGVPDVVTDEQTGLLVAPGDEQALAAAMIRLAGDAAARRRLGLAGRRAASSEFRRERFASDTAELYRRVVAAKRGLSRPGNRDPARSTRPG